MLDLDIITDTATFIPIYKSIDISQVVPQAVLIAPARGLFVAYGSQIDSYKTCISAYSPLWESMTYEIGYVMEINT